MVWNHVERRDLSSRIEILEVIPTKEGEEESLPAIPPTESLAREVPALDALYRFI